MSGSVRIWWPMYPADFAIDTAHLDNQTLGIYVRILNAIWRANGTVKFDPKQLSRIAGFDPLCWDNVFSELEDKFIVVDGMLSAKILLPELDKARANREKKVAAARERWHGNKCAGAHPPAHAPAKQPVCPSPLPSPSPQHKREPAARFTPPSLDEVRTYCLERGNAVEPQRFINHYESNGWRVGRNPMKDWKAAVRTWEKNGYPVRTSQKTTHADRVAGFTAGEGKHVEL